MIAGQSEERIFHFRVQQDEQPAQKGIPAVRGRETAGECGRRQRRRAIVAGRSVSSESGLFVDASAADDDAGILRRDAVLLQRGWTDDDDGGGRGLLL